MHPLDSVSNSQSSPVPPIHRRLKHLWPRRPSGIPAASSAGDDLGSAYWRTSLGEMRYLNISHEFIDVHYDLLRPVFVNRGYPPFMWIFIQRMSILQPISTLLCNPNPSHKINTSLTFMLSPRLACGALPRIWLGQTLVSLSRCCFILARLAQGTQHWTHKWNPLREYTNGTYG